MRPAAFDYIRATTVDGALRAMAAGATPLAGGQSLLQSMRLRQREPRSIVDLASVRELGSVVEIADGCFRIGARVTHRSLIEDRVIAREAPWLTAAALALGDVQVRNLGTVVGNVCWADPRANMAVALLASDALLHTVSPASPDQIEFIPADGFFTDFRETVLGNRLATAVEVPRVSDARGRYLEFSRQPQDLALCNVCVVFGAHGARVAAGGVHARPVRLRRVETAVANGDRSAIDRALIADLDADILCPVTDHFGSASYKLNLAAVLVRRTLADLGVLAR